MKPPMEFQSNFSALSLTSQSSDSSSCSSYGCNIFFGDGYDLRKRKETTKQTGFPSIMVHSDYPYRICEAGDSFAGILGFKPKELQGGSLRLIFGPETDLQKVKKIVGDECQDDNDRLIFYRKDGDEVACSIHCTTSDLPSGERVSSISILNYRSAQSCPLTLTAAINQPAPTLYDGVLTKSAVSSLIAPIDSKASISHDPALLVHLSAIRRCRRSSAA